MGHILIRGTQPSDRKPTHSPMAAGGTRRCCRPQQGGTRRRRLQEMKSFAAPDRDACCPQEPNKIDATACKNVGLTRQFDAYGSLVLPSQPWQVAAMTSSRSPVSTLCQQRTAGTLVPIFHLLFILNSPKFVWIQLSNSF